MGVEEQGQGGARGPQRLCLLFSPKHWCVTESHHFSQPVLQRQHQVLAPLPSQGLCAEPERLHIDHSGVVLLRMA